MSGLRGSSRAFGLPARLVLFVQLLATAATLGWVPGNPAKLMTMLVIWGLGFGRVRAAELLAMGGVDLLFVLMNAAALSRGSFVFDHPDLFGMPVYEFVMWGFYTLHTIRFLDGAAPRGRLIRAWAAAIAFALPFALIAAPAPLLTVAGLALAACLVVFHEKMDFAYAGYMAALGVLIEYVGVWTGQWHYPGRPYGGVPLWSFVMWAGVGLFTRRLIVPLLPHLADSRLHPQDAPDPSRLRHD